MNTKEQVLQNCTIEGNVVKLPQTKLDRNLYLEVAKSLKLIGGKWKGGKIAGFVFVSNPKELLEQISNGDKRNLKKEFQFFGTPDILAEQLVFLADLQNHDNILEPSAGQGAIIKAINKACNVVPDCYELMDVNRIVLNKTSLSFNLIGQDFLQHKDKEYTKIIANPPFTKNQDIEHIRKMVSCLSRNGRLVSICSESAINGQQRKQIEFQIWLENLGAEILDIPKGTFKESGTMISAKIIIINKSL